MIQAMAKQYDQARAKLPVQVRIDPDAIERLDALAARTGRSRSELVNFASIEWSELSLEEINRRIQKMTAKSR